MYGGKRFILDGNCFNRLSQLVAVGVCQEQNRFFGMIYGFGRQARLVIQNQCDAILPGDIFRRYDDKIVPVDIRIKGNLFDFAARDIAAHRRAVEHAGQNHVINIARRSRDFVPAFLARHRCTDDMTDGHDSFAGRILYETAEVSNPYLKVQFAS